MIECVARLRQPLEMCKVEPIENRKHRCKPAGGLWTSPTASEYGWKWWVENEGGVLFNTEYFATHLTVRGNIYTVDSMCDLLNMPLISNERFMGVLIDQVPDFELMVARDRVDAIHLTWEGQCNTRLTQPNLYGWDCETVLVLNPEAITIEGVFIEQPIENKSLTR
jgi:hypothetical protein